MAPATQKINEFSFSLHVAKKKKKKPIGAKSLPRE